MAQVQQFGIGGRVVKKFRRPEPEEPLPYQVRNGCFVRGHNRGRKVYAVEYVRAGRLVRFDGGPLTNGAPPEFGGLRFNYRWGKQARLTEHEKEVALGILLGTHERIGFWAVPRFVQRVEDGSVRARRFQHAHFFVELVRFPESFPTSTLDSLCGRHAHVETTARMGSVEEEAQHGPYLYVDKVHDLATRKHFCCTCAGLVLEQKL